MNFFNVFILISSALCLIFSADITSMKRKLIIYCCCLRHCVMFVEGAKGNLWQGEKKKRTDAIPLPMRIAQQLALDKSFTNTSSHSLFPLMILFICLTTAGFFIWTIYPFNTSSYGFLQKGKSSSWDRKNLISLNHFHMDWQNIILFIWFEVVSFVVCRDWPAVKNTIQKHSTFLWHVTS